MALNVKLVVVIKFHNAAPPVSDKVPFPKFKVLVAEPVQLKLLTEILLLLVAKSNVPVNAPHVMVLAVHVPPPTVTVTVPPPDDPSNTISSDVAGSHAQVRPPLVIDQCAESDERFRVPAPPIKKHVPPTHAALAGVAKANSTKIVRKILMMKTLYLYNRLNDMADAVAFVVSVSP